jgi:glycosyltransferase involved in cell wall biosynthesis
LRWEDLHGRNPRNDDPILFLFTGKVNRVSRSAYLTESNSAPEKVLRVFVLLAHSFGAQRWKERWAKGEFVGTQEQLPYGYFHCAGDNCEVQYSEDAPESRPTQFVRLCLRRLLGFDLIHAWRNRERIKGADVVWTHTELEHLAVMLLFRFGLARERRPRLIAQNIWLFGRWSEFWPPKRWLYRQLLRRADLLTVQCKDNLAAARRLLPHARVQLVRYGNDLGKMVTARPRTIHTPIRILSLGNDMHRDWATLIATTAGRSEFEVRIAAKTISRRAIAPRGNLMLLKPNSAQLVELYEWADLVVIPLKPNIHASGITALTEAVLFGVPVVCTGTGGLQEYFDHESVRYVPPADAESIRRAINEVAKSDWLRFELARNAQARLIESNWDTRARAERLATLSRELLSEKILGVSENPITNSAAIA